MKTDFILPVLVLAAACSSAPDEPSSSTAPSQKSKAVARSLAPAAHVTPEPAVSLAERGPRVVAGLVPVRPVLKEAAAQQGPDCYCAKALPATVTFCYPFSKDCLPATDPTLPTLLASGCEQTIKNPVRAADMTGPDGSVQCCYTVDAPVCADAVDNTGSIIHAKPDGPLGGTQCGIALQ